MICVILAAGYATRLYPLTENFPKPLLEIKGKTILDWLLDDIDGAGLVRRYVVVSNHRYAGHFQAWAAQKQLSAPIEVLDDGSESNDSRLGAVKDIQLAIHRLKLDDDLFVIAGDNLLDFSLTRLLAYAGEKRASCVMRYHEPSLEKLRKTGVAQVDARDRIVRMEEKPAEPFAHWCVPPFYVYRREDLHFVREAIEGGCNADAPGSFIAWLSGRTAVYAMEMPGCRYDIGNLESYHAVQSKYEGIVK